MKLTREQALSYHRQMWTDMQRDLGDYPWKSQREQYKRKWIRTHFPELYDETKFEYIDNNCFLCEYTVDSSNVYECNCPIEWPAGRCEDGDIEDRWYKMPISRLLALPERKIDEVN